MIFSNRIFLKIFCGICGITNSKMNYFNNNINKLINWL